MAGKNKIANTGLPTMNVYTVHTYINSHVDTHLHSKKDFNGIVKCEKSMKRGMKIFWIRMRLQDLPLI